MKKYLIINEKEKTYYIAETDEITSEWKNEFPNTKNADWLDVEIHKISDLNITSNGIYYLEKTFINDTFIQLIIFIENFSFVDIELAKDKLRKKYNVVFFDINRLNRVY